MLVYSCFPVYVPEHRRSAVAESITRINYGMAFGNLEMDFSDGEVRVRTVVDADGEIRNPMIERALESNLGTAGHVLAPLLAVAFGNAAPDTVLDLVAQNEDTSASKPTSH